VVAGKVERVEHAGVPVTVPPRLALDLGMGKNFVEAVADLDEVLRAGLVGEDEVARFLATSHERGVRRARRAFSFRDVRAASRQETRVRLLLVFAGLRPVPQFEVWDKHGFVARVDLAFPLHRVAVECNGTWHADLEQAKRDQVRLGALRAAGWQVVRVTAAPLREDPHAVVAAVRAALAGAR
jgi:very-short-patch-repair endonuclease